MSKSILKILLGFLVSPAIPALLVYLISCIFDSHSGAAWSAKLILVMGYLAGLIIGVPTYLLLRKINKTSFLAYIVSGLLVGLIFSLIIVVLSVTDAYNYGFEHAVGVFRNTIGSSLMGMVSGAIAGGVFWFISVRGNAQAS